VVEERAPERFIEVNRRAFEAGRHAGLPGTWIGSFEESYLGEERGIK
jgi:hypothetical protein